MVSSRQGKSVSKEADSKCLRGCLDLVASRDQLRLVDSRAAEVTQSTPAEMSGRLVRTEDLEAHPPPPPLRALSLLLRALSLLWSTALPRSLITPMLHVQRLSPGTQHLLLPESVHLQCVSILLILCSCV